MSHIERAIYFDKDGRFRNDVDTFTIFPYISQARMYMHSLSKVQETVTLTGEKLIEPFKDTFEDTKAVRDAFIDGASLALIMARTSVKDVPNPDMLAEILREFSLQQSETLYGVLRTNQTVLDRAHETYEASRIRIPEIVPILEKLDPLYKSVRPTPDHEVTAQVMKYGFSGTVSRLADVADFMLQASHLQSDDFDQAFARLVNEQGQS